MPTKVCAGPCGQRKPWSAFYRRANGSPVAKCKPCHNAARARWARENRERHNAANRAERQAMRQDPERHARRLARHRVHATDWRRRQGMKPRARAMRATETLPVGPFVEWLHSLNVPLVVLADAAGIQDRILRRILNGGQENVSIDTVDRVLLAEGSTDLDELYPLDCATHGRLHP